MTRHNDDARLPVEVETLLSGWPVKEPGPVEWDERADATIARLASVKPGDTSEEWLAAPLPAQEGEGSLNVADDSGPRRAASRDAPPVSLAALARASLEKSPEQDSKDIVRESLSVAKAARASRPSVPHSVRDSAARLAVAQARPSTPELHEAQPPAKSGTGRGFVAGMLVATVAMAAVVTIFVARQKSEPVTAAPTPPATTAAAAAVEPAPKEKLPAADEAEEVLSLDDLPADAAAPERVAVAAKPQGKVGMAGKAARPEPEAKGAPPSAGKTAESNDKDDPNMRPAAKAGSIPEKPSVGAVQAAVASVLGGARACVAGHDQPSRATITFGSNGRVKGVAISGTAAGTPAEGCIRSALSGARVQPFARESFSASITVRP